GSRADPPTCSRGRDRGGSARPSPPGSRIESCSRGPSTSRRCPETCRRGSGASGRNRYSRRFPCRSRPSRYAARRPAGRYRGSAGGSAGSAHVRLWHRRSCAKPYRSSIIPSVGEGRSRLPLARVSDHPRVHDAADPDRLAPAPSSTQSLHLDPPIKSRFAPFRLAVKALRSLSPLVDDRPVVIPGVAGLVEQANPAIGIVVKPGGQYPFLEHCLLLGRPVGIDLHESTTGGQTLHLFQCGDQIGAFEIVDGVEGEAASEAVVGEG